MKRIFVIVLFLGFLQVNAQISQDVYIQFKGTILSAKDSTVVSGVSVQYEKLPYYDDMGVGKTNDDGNVEFYLIKDLKYSFSFKKAEFEPGAGELQIGDGGGGQFSGVFYIKPIEKPVEEIAEPEHFTLENLIFDRGSAAISPSSYSGLDELANWINSRPTMVIQLEGHTDFAGNAEANMNLSQARVDAVKEYLLKKGVNKNKVLTKAFGGSQPLSTDRTDEAKERNRRVEVSVVSK